MVPRLNSEEKIFQRRKRSFKFSVLFLSTGGVTVWVSGTEELLLKLLVSNESMVGYEKSFRWLLKYKTILLLVSILFEIERWTWVFLGRLVIKLREKESDIFRELFFI